MTSEAGKKAAHTPGPWHWDSDAVKNDPTGRVRYRVCALGKTITQVYYSSYEGGATNAEADARLIAAAPDMYAALQCAANVLFLLSDDVTELGCGAKKVAEMARAALASADPLDRAIDQRSEAR